MTQQLPTLPPAQEQAFRIHYAKVLLREASARRHSFGGFHAILLAGAARARREAAAVDLAPEQPDMFATFASHDGGRP